MTGKKGPLGLGDQCPISGPKLLTALHAAER